MKSQILIATLTSLAWMILSGCSTTPTSSSGSTSDLMARLGPGETGVDISYVIGHNHHRFVAEAAKDKVVARTFFEHHILEEGLVDKNRYDEFFKKASQFTAIPKREPSNEEPCRTPFTVTVRIGKSSQSSVGCRSSDEGALSKLVRDAEFLLYSKK